MGQGCELTRIDAHEAHRLAIKAVANAQQAAQAQATLDKLRGPARPASAGLR